VGEALAQGRVLITALLPAVRLHGSRGRHLPHAHTEINIISTIGVDADKPHANKDALGNALLVRGEEVQKQNGTGGSGSNGTTLPLSS
jgi:hypothetical protein